MSAPPPLAVLCSTRSTDRANHWTLVLEAAGVPHRVHRSDDAWHVLVAHDALGRAQAALADAEREHAEQAASLEGPVEYERSLAGVGFAAVAWLVYLLAGGRGARSTWLLAGSALADRIVAGEWWRTVTALTLHADPSHLANNVLGLAVLGTALARLVGPGLAAWSLLVSGALGNALNASVRSAPHDSIGASTAVFGAVGVLAGVGAVRARRQRRPGRGAWIPLAAGLALLALFGTAERTDHGAHLFGFVAGTAVGMLLAWARRFWPGPVGQRRLAVAAAAALAACWLIAFRFG